MWVKPKTVILISMNDNIEKTLSFIKIKYDPKGHSRSHEMTFYLKFHILSKKFCVKSDRIHT